MKDTLTWDRTTLTKTRTHIHTSVLTLSIGSGNGGWMTLKEEERREKKFVTIETPKSKDTWSNHGDRNKKNVPGKVL